MSADRRGRSQAYCGSLHEIRRTHKSLFSKDPHSVVVERRIGGGKYALVECVYREPYPRRTRRREDDFNSAVARLFTLYPNKPFDKGWQLSEYLVSSTGAPLFFLFYLFFSSLAITANAILQGTSRGRPSYSVYFGQSFGPLGNEEDLEQEPYRRAANVVFGNTTFNIKYLSDLNDVPRSFEQSDLINYYSSFFTDSSVKVVKVINIVYIFRKFTERRTRLSVRGGRVRRRSGDQGRVVTQRSGVLTKKRVRGGG